MKRYKEFVLPETIQNLCGVKKQKVLENTYSADFETSTREWLSSGGGPDDTARVWVWGCYGLFNDVRVCSSGIWDFVLFCYLLGVAQIYFANAKFDYSYIADFALKNGYPFEGDLCDGSFFRARLFDSRIFDSLKLLGGSIATQQKTWNLPIGKIDEPEDFYKIYRDKKHVPSEQEKKYLFHDVAVQRLALLSAFRFGLGCGALTKAGTAFYLLKEYLAKNGFSFSELFPKTEDRKLARACYNGGWCLVHPKKAGKIRKNVKCYDINAMYAAAYSGSLPYYEKCSYMDVFPVGLPLAHVEGNGRILTTIERNKDLYFFVRVKIKWLALRSGKIPTLQFKRRYTMKNSCDTNARQYREWFENCDIFLDKRDYFNIFLQDYEGEYELVEADFYDTKKFADVFGGWAKSWSKLKAETSPFLGDGKPNPGANAGLRQIAKDMLTNPYGKFGMRAEKTIDIPDIVNGVVKYSHKPDENDSSIYVEFACSVTSAARSFITRVAQDHARDFCYSDTDSLKMECELPAEVVDPNALGFFKMEGIYDRAKFLRAKTYMYEEKGKIGYTVCGLPNTGKEILQTYPNDEQFQRFKIGLIVKGCKLSPRHVPGGVILDNIDFSINEVGFVL